SALAPDRTGFVARELKPNFCRLRHFFTNDHPAAVGGDPKPLVSLEVKPVRGNTFPGHVRFKQVRSGGHYPVKPGGVDENPARAGILPFDGLDQFPGAPADEGTRKLNMKVARTVSIIDVKF
ncbi:MAG: hypothetical protein JJV98_00900, partial [Desulfosarcina sp.]|nr:hypothetical protein [Desulfobacterales bacterium]